MSDSATGAADVAGLLASWLPRQRWFAAGPGGVTLSPAGQIDLPFEQAPGEPLPGADGAPATARSVPTAIVLHIVSALPAGSVSDPGAAPSPRPVSSATYQVPLTYRTAPVPELAHALLGEVSVSGNTRWVYDGPHDPAFVTAWTNLVASGTAVLGEGTPRSRVRGVRRPGEPTPEGRRASKVLSGEQSNTSIIVGDGGPDPIMIKIIRVLQPGRNPDVVVPDALATAGCERVPRLVGWVEGEWLQPGGAPAWGHLSAFAEFVSGSADGWKLACSAVSSSASFASLATDLGRTTAEVLDALARALPTVPTPPAALAEIADHLDGRLAWALAAVPALAEHAEAAAAVIARIRTLEYGPDRQIIHGDLHLGQALHSATRGWVVLDFEGEPLRPLAERGEPDLALRDVAGMLRSFDYAARHSVLGLSDDEPRALAASAWASECREAFLAGYSARAGRDPVEGAEDAILLRAMELDKALYETVYETRHRPGWVEVPLRAVRRLLA